MSQTNDITVTVKVTQELRIAGAAFMTDEEIKRKIKYSSETKYLRDNLLESADFVIER